MPVLALAPRLVAFVRDAFRYAATTSDADARRLIVSRYSGVARGDARALCVVAGEHGNLRETIAAGKLTLEQDVASTVQRFVAALDGLAGSYRAQGSTASELFAAVRLAFRLDENAAEGERAALDALEAAAKKFDQGLAATIHSSVDEAGARRAAAIDWDSADAAEMLAGEFERSISAAAPAKSDVAQRRGLHIVPQPLGPHLPESATPVARRERQFSASALGLYAECERKWYYRYVCAAVEDKGSSASCYGSAFHRALEKFHRQYPRADAAPPETLANCLDGWIQTAFEHYRTKFDTNVEYELLTRRARRTARRYLEWFLERSRAHPFTVVDAEAQVELEMGGYEFTGYVDRLDRDDATGSVTVVDYKTGSIAESAEEYREGIGRLIDFQLPFYYWARTAQGDRVTRLALVPLKDDFRDVRPIELEVVPTRAPASRNWDSPSGVIGIDELERARARMIELAHHLRDEPIEHFRTTDDPEACRYCAYVAACRSRPSRRERRYAG